jgi:hypothetical protein
MARNFNALPNHSRVGVAELDVMKAQISCRAGLSARWRGRPGLSIDVNPLLSFSRQIKSGL